MKIFKEIKSDIKKYYTLLKVLKHLKEAIEKDEFLNEFFFEKDESLT